VCIFPKTILFFNSWYYLVLIVFQHPGESVAVHAKVLGQLWGNMSVDEKQVYQLKAAEEREAVANHIKALKDAGQFPESGPGGNGDAAKVNELIFPLTRIKKIVKLDPEVKGISKEAMLLISRSAEMFTKQLGENTCRIAQIHNRRKVYPQDVVDACDTGEQYIFLREDMKDLVHDQLEQKRAEDSLKGKGEDSKKTPAAIGMKPLTHFFAPKK
jgi:DNA-directed RNA polymerase I subunit RPA43